MSGEQDVTPREIHVTERRTPITLPTEVEERIISFLDAAEYVERRTILDCALVCRDWVPFCRYKLFHTISLYNRSEFLGFRELLLDTPPSLEPFLKSVRELWILDTDAWLCYNNTPALPSTEENHRKVRPWTHLLLAYSVNRLTGLVLIIFQGVDWRPPWFHDRYFSVYTQLLSVTQLALTNCLFDSVRQLQRLILAFPVLSQLWLDNTKLKCSTTPAVKLYLRRPNLTFLNIRPHGEVMAILCRWLVETQLVAGLSTLCFYPKNNADGLQEAFEGLLQAIGSSLMVLRCWILKTSSDRPWKGLPACLLLICFLCLTAPFCPS